MADLLFARIVLFVVLVGAGALVIWMARATASGRLKRNPLAGIRTPRTMESDEAWLAAHVRAKRPTLLAGASSVGMGCVALVPMPPSMLGAVTIAGSVVMVAFLLYGVRVGGRAAVEATQSSSG